MSVYKDAILTWGEDAQIRQFFEESAELQFALCKYQRGKDNLDNIAEEIADCKIILKELICLFETKQNDFSELVKQHKKKKIKRLKKRVYEQRKIS